MGEMSFNAKTLEEAITKACIELGVTSDKITYEVLDQGSKGFLGIGARNCVINVTLNDEKAAADDKKKEVKTEAPKKEEKIKADTFEKKESRSDISKKNVDAENTKPVNAENVKPEQTERVRKPVVLAEDPVERAKTFLESLFNAMEMKIDYSGKYDDEINELTVNLSGDDMGVLIGKRGQTLDSLQYLTSQVVNKHQNGYIRVKLDTENYRERRRDTLESFAANMAHKVRKNKRPVVLEPMNAYERRIIHSALQNEKDVTTRSEGEEPYRHVVICPVRKKSGSRQ